MQYRFTAFYFSRIMEESYEINTLFWIGTIVMLCVGMGLIVVSLYYSNRLNKVKKNEAEMLLKVSLESEKIERERIAADLHDSVSSDLSAIRNYLIYLLNSETLNERKEIFVDLKEGVEKAMENTKQISYKLAPPFLEKFGLIKTIEDYCLNLNKNKVCVFRCESKIQVVKLSKQGTYELFRIVQELSNNLIKYGEATQCDISFELDNQELIMCFSDDGKVFNFKEALLISKGMGLKNIASRVQLLKGRFYQKHENGKNQIEIKIPLT